ncbi:transcription factor [Candida orthopsilosis Co 90-125]|uniref:Transcription factor n=1 Tax=Candida orthopsilosis (strain 90-125) TaxID=1136231 RepID=H8WW00_CANO9|nr:transcription factor [Candida orthopsilosis Co 90-125]CCG20624.1 transcription factor [Candida orthopsilosis Co 90-125]
MKTCYYKLLEVSSTASDSELKKAYRRKALQLHPDKNPGNVEDANHKFSLVSAAYEVLSDPQERAWYDSHKSSILNDEDVVDDGVSHIPSISSDEILRYFNPSMYSTIDDTISGFYSIVSRIFERLAREEIQHGRYQNIDEYYKYKDDDNNVYTIDSSYLKYPLFGNSHADYLSIKQFYQIWSNFTTCKSFNWKYEYRYSTAQDRRTRRLMERENKKISDEARKEYNETVRKFVGFIKKRDPRVKLAQDEFNKQQRKKQMEEMQQQIRHQKLMKQKQKLNGDQVYQEQSWQKLDEEEVAELEQMLAEEYDLDDVVVGTGEAEDFSTDSEFASDDEEDFDDENGAVEEVHEFECIVCDRILKNEQQFKIHEESKKHKKAVRQMKWEMKQEGIDLGIDEEDDDDAFETAESDFNEGSVDTELSHGIQDNEIDALDGTKVANDFTGEADIEKEKTNGSLKENRESNGKSIDSSDVSRLDDEKSNSAKSPSPAPPKLTDEEIEKNKLEAELAKLLNQSKLDDSDDDWDTGSKKNKKKKKKTSAKTKLSSTSSPQPEQSQKGTSNEETTSIASSSGEKCVVCGQSFDSRNQLFQHVKQENHAVAPSSTSKSKKKKSKRK